MGVLPFQVVFPGRVSALALVQKVIPPTKGAMFWEIADLLLDRFRVAVVPLEGLLAGRIGLPGLFSDGIEPFQQALVVKDVRAGRVGRPGDFLAHLKGIHAHDAPIRVSFGVLGNGCWQWW